MPLTPTNWLGYTIVLGLPILIYFWFMYVVAYMAYNRRRCVQCWLVYSIVFTPILAMISLALMGYNRHRD